MNAFRCCFIVSNSSIKIFYNIFLFFYEGSECQICVKILLKISDDYVFIENLDIIKIINLFRQILI